MKIERIRSGGKRDKGMSLGQKEVEQMMGTREMSNEERKQSKKKKQRKLERQSESSSPSGT